MTATTSRTLSAAAIVLSSLLMTGCQKLGYVEKAKYDKLQKDYAETRQKLEELQKKAEAPPVHHYSLHREGLRTFRFDADTGETCIQLTTESDWKNLTTKAQSCDCADAQAAYERLYQTEAASAYADAMASACGTDEKLRREHEQLKRKIFGDRAHNGDAN